jgi:predicted nucleic acid-binding protein
MSREFVDTNVVVYAYDATAGERHDRALDLMSRLGRDRRGALSVQVLQEFYVTAIRLDRSAIARTMARDELRLLSRWPTHSPLATDVLAAAEIAEQNTISFWDGLIVRSASELECDVLWTEDLNPGQRIAGVEVRSPFADVA